MGVTMLWGGNGSRLSYISLEIKVRILRQKIYSDAALGLYVKMV